MKWLGVITAVCAFVLVGCGDDGDRSGGATGATGTGGATVAAAPTASTGETGGETAVSGKTGAGSGSKPDCVESKQKPDIDLDLVVGHPFPEAKRNAEAEDFLLRMIVRDGKSLVVTLDYRENRINVAVRDGEVSQYCHMG